MKLSLFEWVIAAFMLGIAGVFLCGAVRDVFADPKPIGMTAEQIREAIDECGRYELRGEPKQNFFGDTVKVACVP